MDKLLRCRESVEKVRGMLASDRLLAGEQMEEAVSLLSSCEDAAAPFSNVLLELRAARLKVMRCEVKGEFVDFLEMQYRARGLSTPRKIAALVVLEEATNALKRVTAATMEQMRSSSAA